MASPHADAEILLPLAGVGGTLETDGVRNVRSDEPFLPLAGDPPVAVAFSRGAGTVVFVADGSVFWNQRIVRNGAWAVALVGDGPVRFDEVRHGFEAAPVSESPTGLLAALPDRVRIVSGNAALGPNDGGGVDVVALDDFIYGEPQEAAVAVAAPGTGLLLAAALLGLVPVLRRRR